jgi:hypothetical protein
MKIKTLEEILSAPTEQNDRPTEGPKYFLEDFTLAELKDLEAGTHYRQQYEQQVHQQETEQINFITL